MSRSSKVPSQPQPQPRRRRAGAAVVAASALVVPLATAGSAAAATGSGTPHRSTAVHHPSHAGTLRSALGGTRGTGSAYAARLAGADSEPGFRRSQFPARGKVAVMVQLRGTPSALAFTAARSAGPAAARAAGARAAAVIAQEAGAVQQHFSTPATAAQTLFTVHNLYAGVAVRTDAARLAALAALPGVLGVHPLPTYHATNASTVPLVGAPAVWSGGASGEIGSGVKVGIIDTGVDYTHAMFGGAGNSRAYDADHAVADRSTLSVPSGDYPSAKVAGGVDLVGDDYQADPSSPAYQPVPHRDPNPLDCNSHGSHVAGTAAGYGVTTNGTTYGLDGGRADPAKYAALGGLSRQQYADTFRIGPGVAPGASLYAIKVFGCDGSTNVVSEALDWSADPNGDGNFDDHLDVVNMSLGSDYEQADSPDAVASQNASLLGITVVASAGNGGDLTAIAGTPAGASRAISVAASDDSTTVYDALQENSPTSQQVPGQRSVAYDWTNNGPTTADVVAVNSTYVPGPDPSVGNADGCDPFTDAQKAAVAGKIAWVEWTDVDANRRCGSVRRSGNAVAAGAVGVVIADDANAFASGITGSTVVPVFEIRSSDAATMRPAAQGGAGSPLNVTLTNDLRNSQTVVDPSTVDQVAGFSSRGWGSEDTVKPDLAAPGVTVFSASVGTGNEGQTDSGTSMAAPHTAGMAALVHAAHPSWYPEQVKAALMNTASNSVVRDSAACATTSSGFSAGACTEAPDRVGAGRGQVDKAVATQVIAYEFSRDGSVGVSFGHPQVTAPSTYTRLVKVQNDSDSEQTYDVSYAASNDGTAPAGVTFSTPATVTVGAHRTATMSVTMTVDPARLSRPLDATRDATASGLAISYVPEAAGVLRLSQSGAERLRLPVYAAPKATSTVHAAAARTPFSQLGGDTTRPTVDFSQLGVTGSAFSTPDYQSLTAGFQLGATSPKKPACAAGAVDFTTCTPAPSAASGDVLSVGATSDAGLGTGVNSLTYVAVHSAGAWLTPASFVENDVLIDATGDGEPDAVLYNTRLPGSDLMIAELDSLTTGDVLDLEYLNGVGGGTDSNAFDNDTMVLPVLTSALASLAPAGSDGSISYSVQAYTQDTGLSDTTAPARFNPTRPGLGIDDGTVAQNAFDDSFSAYPVWWQPSSSNTLEVFRDKAQLQKDGAHQLMLVNLNDAKGSTVDLVDVADATTTALRVSPSPSVFGRPATAKVTVTASGSPTVVPTGNVVLSIDGVAFATRPLTGGSASFTLPAALKAGSHAIKAAYAGDGGNAPSSASASLTVTRATTATSLALSPATSAYGQVSKATVTVTSAASSVQAVTGTITIVEGTRTVATGSVVGGRAVISLPRQRVGTHDLKAVYGGAANFAGSTSSTVRLSVTKATSRTALSSSATRVRPGSSVTLKAVTTVVAPGVSTVSGTVTFYDGTTSLGSSSTTGTVSRVVTRLRAGTHRFRAVYSGSATVATSTGTVTVTVA